MRKPSRLLKAVHVLVGLALILSVTTAVSAQDGGGFTAQPVSPDSTLSGSKDANDGLPAINESSATGEAGLVSVIVKLEDASLASYTGTIAGLPATSPAATGADRLDVNSTASQLYLSYLAGQQETFSNNAKRSIAGAIVTNRYTVILGGVSMLVPADQVEKVAGLPGVVAVYPDELQQITTDRSPSFIGASKAWNLLGGQESSGEGIVVGILDTGIWPEHPSFSDPDPSGKPYAEPPASWTGTTCEFGSAIPGDAAFTCNNKLIGAYRFMATYDAFGPALLPGEFLSARDDNGHGTHTSSTSAGNAGVDASIFGVPRGEISGIAPRAHVVMYKVCGDQGCFTSDSAAAVQQAIEDGANVLNFSIGGGNNPYGDAVELAFLDAYAAGIFVAASAGNSGPGADTTGHRGPWVTTVAASTTDRAFVNTTTLTADNGDTLEVSGASVTLGIDTPKAVVSAPGDPLCLGPFAAGTFTDQIVMCQRGGVPSIGRVQKGFNVLEGGAAGMLLYNPVNQDQETDNHFLPASHLQAGDGAAVLAFLASHTGVTATMTAGVATNVQGDIIAGFSSRGGPGQVLGVSKPDVTAPGVQILAGHSPMSVDLATGPAGEYFQAIAGTSMSSPHVAGAAALMFALHPDWTPGQIKSALMTTAKASNVFKEDETTPADAFDYGSGRIDLRKAPDAMITFDVTADEYVAFQNDLWNANYPSVYVPSMPGAITVTRTAHDVSGADGDWRLYVKSPSDVKITVPHTLFVPANSDASFDITIDGRDVPLGEVRFATVYLSLKGNTLHIPITFVRGEPNISLTNTCDPAAFPRGSTSNCTVTFTNETFSDANVNFYERIPDNVSLVPGTLSGASPLSGNEIGFNGTLAGAEPPDVTIAEDPGGTPAGGYLALSLFGVAPLAGVGDETITNFNTAPFVYAGETYSRIGMVSNGYLVVGGGTGADVEYINQILPDAIPPNNVLAPFWTDLNPGVGGAMRVAALTDGVNNWLVFEWEAVPEYGSGLAASFQAWVGTGGVQDITFVYDVLEGDGDGGYLTVGAENRFGNRGANYYADGSGTLPTSTTELRVSSVPGTPGETHTVTFTIRANKKPGPFAMYAELTSDLFQGTNIARFLGEVLP